MKRNNTYIFLVLVMMSLGSCGEHKHTHDHEEASKEEHAAHKDILHLNERQQNILNLHLGPLSSREMGAGIAVNGVLEIPPQSQASVSSYVGANVKSIRVIEGDKVTKGQVLASISHPDLISMQMEFLEADAEKEFQEKEFTRKQTLYKEAVISGGKFQKAEATYKAALSRWKAHQSKLKMLDLDINKLHDGEMANEVYLRSPIDGYVRLVEVTLGKYVSPNQELFEIVNNEHIHADLMVYEKDIFRIFEGQKVHFNVGNRKDVLYEARIFSVGKSFEEERKAVHLHADIEGDLTGLIPGTYVQGKILTEKENVQSLPKEAIVEDDGRFYAFIKEDNASMSHEGLSLRKVELLTGARDSGYIGVSLVEELPASTHFVLNAAYYLLAEMNKEEAGHEH